MPAAIQAATSTGQVRHLMIAQAWLCISNASRSLCRSSAGSGSACPKLENRMHFYPREARADAVHRHKNRSNAIIALVARARRASQLSTPNMNTPRPVTKSP